MNTRKWVWQALEAICLEGAYSNLYLQQNLRQVKESDRALATQIVYGTLQNGRLLRWQWETKVRRIAFRAGGAVAGSQRLSAAVP